jgi:hypothetical protein
LPAQIIAGLAALQFRILAGPVERFDLQTPVVGRHKLIQPFLKRAAVLPPLFAKPAVFRK